MITYFVNCGLSYFLEKSFIPS